VLAFGGDGQKSVLKTTADCPAPLLAAIHVAFAQHRPLVLSPDTVWLTILSGVARHVKINTEALRPRLVRHKGRRELTVILTESLELNPAAIRDAVADFRTGIAREIGEGPAALLTCDFSTTSDVERTASEILLMDTYSPYFDFVVMCVCGIPEITLLGEARDWRAIRERVDVLTELDLGWWASSLAPILEKLVAASEGRPDAPFFRDIYKPQDAYGGEIIVGWSARFYPYVGSGGRFEARNPLLELPLDYRPPKQDQKGPWYNGVGIRTRDVPASIGTCIVRVEDAITQRRYSLEVRGGLVGVEVDAQGRLAPCAGWTVGYAKANLGTLMASIRSAAPAVPPRSPTARATRRLPTKDRVRHRDESTHRTRQVPRDIEVVGESLAELLSRALARDGELPSAVTTLAAKFADPASWQHLLRNE
jgi:hypothetical protein